MFTSFEVEEASPFSTFNSSRTLKDCSSSPQESGLTLVSTFSPILKAWADSGDFWDFPDAESENFEAWEWDWDWLALAAFLDKSGQTLSRSVKITTSLPWSCEMIDEFFNCFDSVCSPSDPDSKDLWPAEARKVESVWARWSPAYPAPAPSL